MHVFVLGNHAFLGSHTVTYLIVSSTYCHETSWEHSVCMLISVCEVKVMIRGQGHFLTSFVVTFFLIDML